MPQKRRYNEIEDLIYIALESQATVKALGAYVLKPKTAWEGIKIISGIGSV